MARQDVFDSPAQITHRIGANGRFSLNNVSGDIRLRGIDGDGVTVIARWEGTSDQPLPINVRRGDGSLHIELDDKGSWFSFRSRASIAFEVSVPAAARVEVQTVSADVVAHGLVGDQSFRTVSGDLVIDDGGGRVSAVTVSGDAQFTGVRPVEADLSTTSGDIEASAPLFQPVRLKTVSGDMTVRGGFAVGPQHTVESVSGDLSVEAASGLTLDSKRGLDFTKKDNRPMVWGDGSASLRFRSLSGDVRLGGFSTAQPPQSAEPVPPAMSSQDSLEVLRALERGEIDVEEASRRLEGASNRA